MNPFAVLDTKLETHHLSKGLLLPLCVQSLISEMGKALVVSFDYKLTNLQVTTPLLHSHKDGKVLFLVN